MVTKEIGRDRPEGRSVLVCEGMTCLAAGSLEVRKAFEREVKALGLTDVTVDFTGCDGFCEQGPLVFIEPDGILYTHVAVDDVPEICRLHLKDHLLVERLVYLDPATGRRVPRYAEIDFYRKQTRIVLRNCGRINPERIDDYILNGGYEALRKALTEMTPEEVVEEIRRSGLRGRGGAGFPTGLKWDFCRKAPGDVKYMICNADEGDPGAFMDRGTLEGDPHTVVEGMIIAAYAMGAAEGFFYVRAEYPIAIRRLKIALEQAREHGFLGEDILGTGFSMNIRIREGAGAFVCGEETALIRSIEGGRGEPRPRPPFPATRGLWGRPTNINNVETLANVAPIIQNGADWFAAIGTDDSKGTKVFSLVGKVNRPSLVEVPMGTPVKDIVYDIGGGVPNDRRLKAVQTGGPSGGCIPADHLDVPVDYETLKELGSIIGSGGMVVMDEDTCMVDIARYFLEFTAEESCGQCTPCRVGTKRMLQILDQITKGKGRMSDLEVLEELSQEVRDSSLCGLGQTAPNPVLTTLRYFRDEYEEHIEKGLCQASVCASLFKSPCQNTCPVGTDVPGFIQLISEGRYREAYALNREDNPLPATMGRICEHPCEARCQRAQIDHSLAIRDLKRFCADMVMEDDTGPRPTITCLPPVGKRIAIVGGGPSGLSAAYFLARLGYDVAIYDSNDKLGGMLRYAIPPYRLPRHILDREIADIIDLGVEVFTNCTLGRDVALPQLLDENDAIYVAVGTQKDVELGILNERLPGVTYGLEVLSDVNRGIDPDLGDEVLVIGGGNVAIDVARSVLRTGRNVMVCYRREEQDMPAYTEEVAAAVEEGIEFRFLVSPIKILKADGHVRGVRFNCMRIGEYTKWGRRVPIATGKTVDLEADSVVIAIGQELASEMTEELGTLICARNLVCTDADTGATAVERVYAGGDSVTGPSSAILAIAQGKRAAQSIDLLFNGADRLNQLKHQNPITYCMEAPTDNENVMERIRPMETPVRERRRSLTEVVKTYDEASARAEASRCLRCDLSALEFEQPSIQVGSTEGGEISTKGPHPDLESRRQEVDA